LRGEAKAVLSGVIPAWIGERTSTKVNREGVAAKQKQKNFKCEMS
jgi:hypothetical protein